MNLRQFAASASLVVVGEIALSAPANAFSFQTNYTESLAGVDAAKGDIFLDSVTITNGTTITGSTLINSANILSATSTQAVTVALPVLPSVTLRQSLLVYDTSMLIPST